MKVSEISDENKSLLKLRGIKFDFIDGYDNILVAMSLVGKSSNRKNLLNDDVDFLMLLIETFLSQGYDLNDPDIIAAKLIYNKLIDVKSKL